MHIQHVLLLCFLSAVCDGDPLTPTEGSSLSVACSFSVPGRKKFLCKDECKDEDILIATEGDAAHSGRYSIVYQGGTFPVSETVVYVSITRLAKSDSGRYRCGLERAFMPDSYWPFEIRVTDAPKTEAMKQPEQQQRETAAVTNVCCLGYVLLLVVCLSVVVLCAVGVLFYKWKTGVNTRGRSDHRDTQSTTHETSSPVCGHEDSMSLVIYENSSDQAKLY